jgi:hypothetical protein
MSLSQEVHEAARMPRTSHHFVEIIIESLFRTATSLNNGFNIEILVATQRYLPGIDRACRGVLAIDGFPDIRVGLARLG